MSATHYALAIESPFSSEHAEGSATSSPLPSPDKSFEKTDDCKFDGSINGNLVLCGSLNTSGDLSTQPASRSSCTSPPYARNRDSFGADGQNLVMIDQQELLELMQAKKILDSQQNVHRNKGIGQSPEASQVQSPWRDSGARRASITPFESNECNDEIMES